jgi:GTP-binding protein EngB required for normal cell division
MPFNQNHKRYLLTSFEHLDKLLREAAAYLGPPAGGALFPLYVPDATPEQRQVIADYLSALRDVARRFLDSEDIVDERKMTSGLWAFRVALDFAWITITEMEPKHLNGYGALDPGSATAIERVAGRLEATLRQLTEYLERGLDGDVGTRLARLDQTRDEVALLGELRRVVKAHGLVEFHATLSWLVERFERAWLEVAFFGRVSCGKSSLVNALLGQAVLPVGVTPVTAVPIRIVPGESRSATVEFARLDSRRIELDQLADFASEDLNPGNEKRVVHILVELPAPHLAEGVCFVDTPGLGSLATAGAAQSLAYVPRCDIGVLLVDAAGTLSQGDIDVARAILEGGAVLLPVVSKADLLAPVELQKMGDYIRGKLRAALGIDFPIPTVSVVSEKAQMASEWFEQELAPRLRERRALLSTSLRRKVSGLREYVIAALKVRVQRTDAGGESKSRLQALAALTDGRSLLVRSRERIRQLADKLPRYRSNFIDVMAASLANAWVGPAEKPVGDIAALSLARALDLRATEFSAVVQETRQTLEQRLSTVAEAMPILQGDPISLPEIDARPLFDPGHLFAGLRARPGVWGLFGEATRRADARRRLNGPIAPDLARALEAYAGALKSWSSKGLSVLGKAFEAYAAPFSALERSTGKALSPKMEETPASLASDLALLQKWGQAAEETSTKFVRKARGRT